MKQEDKELLLKDLCSRLPYGVKVCTTDNDGSLKNVWDVLWYNTFTEDIKLIHSVEDASKLDDICEVKPYLFPLSSISYKQFKSIERYLKHCEYQYAHSADIFEFISIKTYPLEVIDYFNKHHIDYRGLIERGLAIDASNLNIY